MDKLKKQIKAAKEEKKLAREAAARGEAPPSLSSSSSSSSQKTTTKKTTKMNDDDSDDDFLTVKQVHEWASTNTAKIDHHPDVTEAFASAENKHLKKPKALKIRLDGVAKPMRDAGVQKIVYDDEGNPVQQIQLVEQPRGGQRQLIGVAAQVEERTRRVKAALDQGRSADKERESERIRDKKMQRKLKYLAEKDRKSGESGIAVLGGPVDDDNGHDRSEENHDDDDYSGAEEDTIIIKNKRGSKRGREKDDDDDVGDDDGNDEGYSRRDVGEDEIRLQERLALKFLRKNSF